MDPENQAETVAEAVGENVTAQVETVVEALEERAEQAEQVAEALTEAAIRDLLNQRIEAHIRETETWRAALESRVLEQQSSLTAMQEQLSLLTVTAALPSIPEPVIVEAPSIQPPPPETTEPPPSAIDPATGEGDLGEAKPDETPSAPPKKKRRWI